MRNVEQFGNRPAHVTRGHCTLMMNQWWSSGGELATEGGGGGAGSSPPAWATSLNGINADPSWSGRGAGWGFEVTQYQTSGTKAGVITVYPDGRPTTVTETSDVETWKRPVGTYYDLWDDVRRQNGGTLLSDGALGYTAEFAGIPYGNPNWLINPTRWGALADIGGGNGIGSGTASGTTGGAVGSLLSKILGADWFPWVFIALVVLIFAKGKQGR